MTGAEKRILVVANHDAVDLGESNVKLICSGEYISL
jgi:hypothetical protein